MPSFSFPCPFFYARAMMFFKTIVVRFKYKIFAGPFFTLIFLVGFLTFVQFLYDEHISSRLVKDLRFFKQNREALGQQYPFDRCHQTTAYQQRAFNVVRFMQPGATDCSPFIGRSSSTVASESLASCLMASPPTLTSFVSWYVCI